MRKGKIGNFCVFYSFYFIFKGSSLPTLFPLRSVTVFPCLWPKCCFGRKWGGGDSVWMQAITLWLTLLPWIRTRGPFAKKAKKRISLQNPNPIPSITYQSVTQCFHIDSFIWSSHQPWEVDKVYIIILILLTVKINSIKWFVQDHTISKTQAGSQVFCYWTSGSFHSSVMF